MPLGNIRVLIVHYIKTHHYLHMKNHMRLKNRAKLHHHNTLQHCNMTLKADQKDVFDQLQFIEQMHSDIRFSMGHKLAIGKCSFYNEDHHWRGIKHEWKLIHELPGINVKQLQPFQAHKTLGCHIALNGNQKRQFLVLDDKLRKWNNKIVSSFLNNNDRVKSCEVYMAKSGQYVLSTSSLSQQQYHEPGNA